MFSESLLNDKEDIMGTISYEKYDKYALIRYFVFKKNISYEDLYRRVCSIEKTLIKNNVQFQKFSFFVAHSDIP